MRHAIILSILICGALHFSSCSQDSSGHYQMKDLPELPEGYAVLEASGGGGFWCVCLRDAQDNKFCSWMHYMGLQVMGRDGKPLECSIPVEILKNSP